MILVISRRDQLAGLGLVWPSAVVVDAFVVPLLNCRVAAANPPPRPFWCVEARRAGAAQCIVSGSERE